MSGLVGGAGDEAPGGIGFRPPVEGDVGLVVDAVRSSLAELGPWMPWAHGGYGADSALGWIRGDFGDRYRWLMVEGEGTAGARVVGAVGVNGIDEANRRGNLGYWVRTECAGRGYATRAARAMAEHVLGTGELDRLEICVSVQNEGSRVVAERAGARYEGVARSRVQLHGVAHDCHVFSFVAGDFVGQR